MADSSPGGCALVDIGDGKLKLWQRAEGKDLKADETAAVQAALGRTWSAANLHTYIVEWKSAGERGELPFTLRVGRKLVKMFSGHNRPTNVDPNLEISLEGGAGAGLIDLPIHSDTTHATVWDARLGKYVAFSRFGFGRNVARSESEDFLHWSPPRLVLTTDAKDGPGGQIYGMPTDLYEGLYLGMFWMYREGADAKIDTQLAVSRDGVRWRRVADRQTFLPNAPDGEWDDGMSRVVGRYIVRGDTLYLYYSMVNGPHRSPKFPKPVREYPGAIGLVTLRRDGFVSLDAGKEQGSALTKPFVLPDGELHVNANAEDGGLTVAVLDENGEPFDGFEASQPISADASEAVITWKDATLKSLHGKRVRLRFTVQRAKLFSYWVE